MYSVTVVFSLAVWCYYIYCESKYNAIDIHRDLPVVIISAMICLIPIVNMWMTMWIALHMWLGEDVCK